MLKVGVSEAIDPQLRELLPEGIALEVIPVQPEREIEVEFWIVPPFYRHAKDAWPHLRGVRVAQSSMAGVDFLLKLLPRNVILCDARGVHTIPTAEWAMAAILAAYKNLPFFGEVWLPELRETRNSRSVRPAHLGLARFLHLNVTTP